ncbi:MAG TPA: 16S rRNA (guanine(966)-N(2))-methyltransferase RsmD [Coriobacteriia bacterium]|nr:16S rRNA (guanine(966)-N(2))-methyltransferase RsmD [Coriobacteriia bacterium]
MRIIGGEWRGRRISPPKGTATRPTTDRVREAVFSAIASRIGDDMGGGSVLDAFAGSGALGLEALSRGATSATFVEAHRPTTAVIQSNIESLGATHRARVVASDLFTVVARAIPGAPFALILLDPPYKLDAARVSDALATLAQGGGIEDGALVSWEHASEDEVVWPEGFEPVASKRYGTTAVDMAVYEREPKEQ